MYRILLCEKNAHFKDMLLQIIHSRFPDLDIKWVLSSQECLTSARDFRPDILILGVNIYTGTNQLEILQRLRENHPELHIILFTDYGIEEYRKEAILRGATHIISKETWTGNEILALMKTILASNKRPNDKLAENSASQENLLKRPLEPRQRGPRGRVLEQEYLAHNPDRRKKV
jgi:DNA-binding NarL/FixJ family response regulator